MKVIMDISKDILTDVKGTDFDHARSIVRSYQATIADAIQNAIIIPQTRMTEDTLADFLNKLNTLAGDYGLVVGGYQQEEGMLQLLMVKALDRT